VVDHIADVGEKLAETKRPAELNSLEIHWNADGGVIRAHLNGGKVLWVAYHSTAIVENGWEPFDQPTTAAYVPFALRDMRAKADCGNGRILFAAWGDPCVSQDSFAKIALAAEIIVPTAHRQLCLAELERLVKAGP